jgi:hypothetical protein
MAGKRHDDGRVCLCDRPDGTCAGLAVQRLSRDRVRDLAEEIWTASSGFAPPVRPDGDPRSSRAGASAQTAYRRRREAERAAWRPGWAWRGWAVAGAALGVGLLIGLTVGAWLGWPAAVVAAVFAWSRLRFRPSPGAAVWKRQAAMQRRTAAVLRPMGVVAAPAAVAGRRRPARDRPRPPRTGRGRGRSPGRLGPGPGQAAAVPAQPLAGPVPARRRPPGGGPGRPPRHRPRRPHDPDHRLRAGHQPPPRRPATGGMT